MKSICPCMLKSLQATAVILAFFSPSCFSGYSVNSELKQNSLFGPLQYSYLYNLTRVYREYEFCKLESL